MFYLFSRFLIRLGRTLFLRSVVIRNKEYAADGKPLLLASNHSGSFFDALVLGSYLEQPIHTFARADVFKKPAVAKWLRRINLIPAYRGTEGGREHLLKNEESFRMVRQMFRQNKTIVIFSEGICVNEWNLRPLAKGTGRLAWQTWFGEDAQKELEVVPTGLTYEHYHGPNKKVLVQFGEPIKWDTIQEDPHNTERWLRAFNEVLRERMEATILQTADGKPQPEMLAPYFEPDSKNPIGKFLGVIGRAIHRPFYKLLEQPIAKKTKRTVFFDSVIFGLLVYVYPVVIGLLAILLAVLTNWAWGLAFFIGMPLLARMGNYYR